jgi:hypothetical protein
MSSCPAISLSTPIHDPSPGLAVMGCSMLISKPPDLTPGTKPFQMCHSFDLAFQVLQDPDLYAKDINSTFSITIFAIRNDTLLSHNIVLRNPTLAIYTKARHCYDEMSSG